MCVFVQTNMSVPLSCCVLNGNKYTDYMIKEDNVKNATLCQSEYKEVGKAGHKFEYLNSKV